MRKEVLALATIALAVLTGCADEPIEWRAISYRASQLGDPDARSAILSAGLVQIPGTVSSCIRSIRATGDSLDLFRAWWSARADSSVVLAVQRSSDQGRSWLPPIIADSTDRGRRGCDRPAPANVFDPVSGYLYLVYFIEPESGAGIFFTHSMDRGDLFHATVPVIYGKRPAAASVTGRGDSVVVVFEDPNAGQPRIGYALSHTNGHFFDRRGRVTPSEEPATAPWASLEGNTLTVWWKNGERVGFRSGVWK